ncbi:MAG: ABC transporter substrate-binding protein [Desulfobacterales bacterium]|nr:ABC transporter substrate-binding protein [Desulfobacterales bacterium]
MTRRLMVTWMSAFLVWVLVLSGGTAPAGTLDEIIAGAKKEGTVSLKLRSGFTPKSMGRLEKEIRDKFGVDLKVKFVPTGSMPKDVAQASMEQKTGAPSTYDLLTFMSNHVTLANKAGIMEKIDWKPLITADTNPEVVLENPALQGAIISFTGHLGLIYNTEKIPADQVPRTLSGLADPRWKGKLGVFTYQGGWARWARIMGKEKVYNDLRAILKNGAVGGRYSDVFNRFLINEVWLGLLSSVYLKMAQDKGMPVAWQDLDFSERQNFSVVVLKGAQHPNAAKLVAVYLASPQGARFTLEESGAGNLYYPGNFEHDISSQAKKQGIPEHSLASYPGLLEFHLSKDYRNWQKEIKLIVDSGGER